MKNKLFLFGFMLFQAFNAFSSDSEIRTEPSVAMFKVESSQDYQSLKQPKNMKIFVGEEFLDAIPAQDKDIQKVLKFIEKKETPECVRSIAVLLQKDSVVIAYHYSSGTSLFKEYPYQFQN